MIEFEKTQVFGFEGAIYGMRAAMKSYDKIDSSWDVNITEDEENMIYNMSYDIGPNDLKLATTLVKAGSDHSKFLRDVHVQVYIKAPIYWWKEMDTYKVSTVRLSESTMHTLMRDGVDIHDFSLDNGVEFNNDAWNVYDEIIECLNKLVGKYKAEEDKGKKEKLFRATIQILPEAYMMGSVMDLNYATLRNIAHSDRKNHKLTEWREGFFDWMHTLPYADELIFS